MNIFVLNADPYKSAQDHCDKHVGKMLIETVQLLSTARLYAGLDAPYNITHKNHPCAKWVRESNVNYNWLVELGLGLDIQFKIRFNKSHLSGKALRTIISPPPLPNSGLTEFAQAMPLIYKHSNPVEAYRAYYLGDKRKFAKWVKGTPKPEWWKDESELDPQ